jgi:hypothetical protein
VHFFDEERQLEVRTHETRPGREGLDKVVAWLDKGIGKIPIEIFGDKEARKLVRASPNTAEEAFERYQARARERERGLEPCVPA